jgi:hypothetical protein
MAKKIVIGIAVMSFALLGSSFAGVENIKVSGDIAAQVITRDLSLGEVGGAGSLDAEDFLFSQVRLKFDTDLTENVDTVVQIIYEDLWGDELATDMAGEDEINLDLGYVEFKEFMYQPLTLIVGRQNLRYGNGLIVGDRVTNQTAPGDSAIGVAGDLSLRKSFDAIRAILDYSPYTVDLIYAKVTEGTTNVDDDVNLFGVNVAYQWASLNGITEVYFFGADDSPRTTVAQVTEDQSYTYTVGGRVSFDPNDKVTLGAESAYQFGDAFVDTTNSNTADTTYKLRAWAAQVGGEYRFLNDYNCRIGLDYTYLTGDDDFTDDEHNGWDPLFEDQTPAEILNILGANSNAHFIRLTGSLMPREDIILGLTYARAILAEKFGFGTYQPAVGAASSNTYTVNRNENHFGDEIDIYAIYDYTEDVQLKLLGGWFIPGDFFASANDDVAYSIRGSLAVNF